MMKIMMGQQEQIDSLTQRLEASRRLLVQADYQRQVYKSVATNRLEVVRNRLRDAAGVSCDAQLANELVAAIDRSLQIIDVDGELRRRD